MIYKVFHIDTNVSLEKDTEQYNHSIDPHIQFLKYITKIINYTLIVVLKS